MMMLDSLPPDLHAEYALAYEARAVHDTATLRLADYRVGAAADWVVAVLTPAPGSGSATLPQAHLDGATGRVVAPPQAALVETRAGRWAALAAADPSAPNGGAYAWNQALHQGQRRLNPETVYSPFAYGGAVVFLPRTGVAPDQAFGACKLLFPDWARTAGEGLRRAAQLAPLAARGAGDPAVQSELVDLAAGDNSLLATLALRTAMESPARAAARAPGLFNSADARRLSVFVFLALSLPTPDRLAWLQQVASLVSSSADPDRLAAVALAAFSAGLFAGADADTSQASRQVLGQVHLRVTALGLTSAPRSALALIFKKSGFP